MAQITEVKLLDDLDGGEAAESVSFSLDGKSYEIDLSEKHAAALRDAFAPFVSSALVTWQPFTKEPYGIGLKKGDTEFRKWINDVLEKIAKDGRYEKAWKDTAGKVDKDVPNPPAVNRY